MLDADTVEVIGHTHLELVEFVEHVKLGDGQTIETVDAHRIATDDAVEPATTAAAACGGAEFTAAITEVIVEAALELGGERSLADARGVGLGYADHPINQGWPHPGSNACSAGDGIGGGDVGIGAVVEIKQGALGLSLIHI